MKSCSCWNLWNFWNLKFENYFVDYFVFKVWVWFSAFGYFKLYKKSLWSLERKRKNLKGHLGYVFLWNYLSSAHVSTLPLHIDVSLIHFYYLELFQSVLWSFRIQLKLQILSFFNLKKRQNLQLSLNPKGSKNRLE